MKTPHKPIKIVIVGGGFAGIRTARQLSRRHQFDITLISSIDTFAYYPQLYHTATGGARTESALPLADVLEGTGVHIVRDTITGLDIAAKTVASEGHIYPYDRVIFALGNVTNYFGIKGLEQYSFNIKTIEGAERFKKHLHDVLINKVPDLNYVVVGGGPTGVELAASLGDYMRRITRLHGLEDPKYDIELVEGSPRVLPRSPEAMSARVKRQLEKQGVRVMTGVAVEGETADELLLKGQSIKSRSVVWTAGVANNPFFKAHPELFALAKTGKVEVDELLQAHRHVYVIGDNAATPYSGMAQTAIYDADVVSDNLIRVLHGQRPKVYTPKAPISVIPVGERWAAVQWGKVLMYGYVGFILRRLADLIAYADIESWPKAVKVWLDDLRREDNCKICQP